MNVHFVDGDERLADDDERGGIGTRSFPRNSPSHRDDRPGG